MHYYIWCCIRLVKQVLARIMVTSRAKHFYYQLLIAENLTRRRERIVGTFDITVFQASRILQASEEILPLRNIISITMINYELRLHESLTAGRRILGRENDELCASISFDRSRTSVPTAVILELAAGSDSYWPKKSKRRWFHYVN